MFDDSLCLSVPPDLEGIMPGAELGLVLASLDWERLSDHDLIRVMKAQDRQISHYQAGKCWSIDRITERYQHRYRVDSFDYHEAQDGAAVEIGAALSLTRRTAESETGFSVALLRYRPRVFDALLFGRIDIYRAKILVEATLHVSAVAAGVVIEQVLPQAASLTTSELRALIGKLVIDTDPDAARERYEMSVEDRRVVIQANDSGTANLCGMDVAPHDAESIRRYLHKEAIKFKNLGDPRTMDQLRADIFTDLLRRRHQGSKITRADYGNLTITTTAETLTGRSDESAELNGFGPILADIARQVVEHQEHVERRWSLVDPDTGQPIDGGITRRKPTVAQRRMVEALHPTCLHPGCRMPAVDCDLDHRVPYREVPVTCSGELGPMCRHHHVIRHKYGWSYDLIDGGDFLFTSPFGHQYRTSSKPIAQAQSP
jgi:hypothetical protein